MMLAENPTLYDLLEVAPDASEQDIRTAYMRAKSAYKKDSVALYSLMGQEETEELLHKIEEAYKVLSSPEKRRNYDENHGLLTLDSPMDLNPRPNRNLQKIVSIDRVPPMEMSDEDDILVPPSTDFRESEARETVRRQPGVTPSQAASPASQSSPFAERRSAPFSSSATLAPPSSGQSMEMETNNYNNMHVNRSAQPPASSRNSSSAAHEALIAEIAQETEWAGSFLKKVRMAKNVSVEEIAEFTKISKTYLTAVEDENYARLPASVYIRGFVTQFAKFLRLPPEKVVPAYMARYQQNFVPK
ncbi:MAG: helix-turn-helix domain-containing protein [Methylotenera sp.]|nr:helix-turn-helix domain-containing protein [Oligoflexia bacterium]